VKHVCDKKNRFLLNSPNSESYLDGSVIKGKKLNKYKAEKPSFKKLSLIDLQNLHPNKFLKQFLRLARGKVPFLSAERRCCRRRLCLSNTHCPARIPGKFSLQGTVYFANNWVKQQKS
jgi:hypothetical protein